MTQAQDARQPISFTQSVPVKVEPAPFAMMESVRHLDLRALAREKHVEVEIGYFDTGCHQLVRAVIEEGAVTELKIEPCSDEEMEPASPEMQALLTTAFRRARGRARPWRPVALRRFMTNLQQNVQIDSITCIRICIYGWCFVCCTTIVPNVPFWCGKRVIIHAD